MNLFIVSSILIFKYMNLKSYFKIKLEPKTIRNFISMAVIFIVLMSVLLLGTKAYMSTNVSCRNTSPECLKESIQKALPSFIKGNAELGTEPLDPFVIKKLELVLPGDLKIEFKDGTSKGLRKCIVDSARMIGDTLDLQLHCNLTIIGKYQSSGRLLMFAIDGDGDSMIKCRNINIRFLVKLGTVIKNDGKKYLEIKAYRTHHSFDGQVYYRMTDLIKGSPQISNLVVDFMNRNWKLVAEEFGKPIVEFGITSVLRNVKQFLKMVPLDDLVNNL